MSENPQVMLNGSTRDPAGAAISGLFPDPTTGNAMKPLSPPPAKTEKLTEEDLAAAEREGNFHIVRENRDNNTAAALLFTIIASSAPVIDEISFAI